jgi:AcrR family transcriptional regulator
MPPESVDDDPICHHCTIFDMAVKGTFHQRARQAQLVDVAIELIGEGGLAAASNVAIARRAGISRGVVNYNVGGRDDLMSLIVARVYDLGRSAVLPAVESARDPAAALRAFVTASLDLYVARPADLRALREIYADPDLLERADTAEHRREVDDVGAIVRAGQVAGVFAPGYVDLAVAVVRAALDWGAAAVASGMPLDRVRAEVVAMVERSVTPA